jgi:hypothetical protein
MELFLERFKAAAAEGAAVELKLRVLAILVRLARGRDQTAKFSFLAFKRFCSNLLSPKGWSNELRSSVFLPQRNRSEAEV